MKRLMQWGLIAGAVLSATAGMVRADGPVTRPAAVVAASDTVAFLGVSARPLEASLRAQLQLPEGLGLSVQFVSKTGPANDQVKAGDVLQKMDDQLLVNAAQLQTLVRMHKPGDTVKLSIIRETKPVEVTIKLGEVARPPAATAAVDPFRLPEPMQIPEVPDLNLPGVRQNNVSMAFSDGTYDAHVDTDNDGHKQLVVIDKAGNEVAKGPVDTEDEWKKLPDDVQTHLKVLSTLLFHKRAAARIGIPVNPNNAREQQPVPNTGDRP